jgi:hypothetical protein
MNAEALISRAAQTPHTGFPPMLPSMYAKKLPSLLTFRSSWDMVHEVSLGDITAGEAGVHFLKGNGAIIQFYLPSGRFCAL